MAEFYSFEEVLRELKLSEEELKRMVSEGELRAFRDESKMKFKKDDISNIKRSKGIPSEPTVVVPPPPPKPKDEGLVDLEIVDEEISKAIRKDEEKGTPTEAISTDTLKIEEDVSTSELLTEQTPTEVITPEPVVPVEEEVAERPRITKIKRRRGPVEIPPEVEAELEKRRESPVWTVITLLALVACILSAIIFYDLVRQESGRGKTPIGFAEGMANTIMSRYWNDPGWVKEIEKGMPAEYNAEANRKPTLRPETPSIEE
jgi:hypothetical protein